MERPEIGNATSRWRQQPICPIRIRQTVNQWHRNFWGKSKRIATTTDNWQQAVATSCGKQRLIIIIKNKFIYTFKMQHSRGAQGGRALSLDLTCFERLEFICCMLCNKLHAIRWATRGGRGRGKRWDCRWSAATAVSLREIRFVFMCWQFVELRIAKTSRNKAKQFSVCEKL